MLVFKSSFFWQSVFCEHVLFWNGILRQHSYLLKALPVICVWLLVQFTMLFLAIFSCFHLELLKPYELKIRNVASATLWAAFQTRFLASFTRQDLISALTFYFKDSCGYIRIHLWNKLNFFRIFDWNSSKTHFFSMLFHVVPINSNQKNSQLRRKMKHYVVFVQVHICLF